MICINHINAGKMTSSHVTDLLAAVCPGIWCVLILKATCAANSYKQLIHLLSCRDRDVRLLMDQKLYDAASQRLLLKVIDQTSPL